MFDFVYWEALFLEKAREIYPLTDPSHDLLHICRVVANAKRLTASEQGDLRVVLPAAYFHDFVTVPKDDPRRPMASRLSADAAVAHLRSIDYPLEFHDAIAHAIATHSFSANIPCETLEAKIVQDADRLDALGAIGTIRFFNVGAMMQRPAYDPADFFAAHRPLDDMQFTVDHFFVKFVHIAKTMHTQAARQEAETRIAFMRVFFTTYVGRGCGLIIIKIMFIFCHPNIRAGGWKDLRGRSFSPSEILRLRLRMTA